MPKLSLYRDTKKNDYRFIDRTIHEMFTVGGTDLYIHKYLGPTNQGTSVDATQPQYDQLDPTNIQDLLFLENRDRTYDTSIYRLRGHYSVQNLDFDLSQFGLFLTSDIIFITVHYNDMIDIMGRKLMVGDVIELPHLMDYDPLGNTNNQALKRFYQITDANYASEGFSVTWYPHMWRIKCEPLVNSQEFSQILTEPVDKDNYLGIWDPTRIYPAGYVITFGDKNYLSLQEVPAGVTPPNATYWELQTGGQLTDIISTYNKNLEINDAALREAQRIVPKAGYDTSELYIVPTYGLYERNNQFSGKINQPAPPINIITYAEGSPATGPITAPVVLMRDKRFKTKSPYIKVSKDILNTIWKNSDPEYVQHQIDKFVQASLEIAEIVPEVIGSGSGSVETTKVIAVQSLGPVTGPYGTADNTYATADQDPTQTGFTGTVTQEMDYRADCDPRFQYIARSSPRTFGYSAGYLTGDGQAPNGYPSGAGIAFPQNPQVGDYFLRIDYFPQILYRWDGARWVRISTNVRTETGLIGNDQSQMAGFVNNTNQTQLTNGTEVPEKQALSTILKITPD